MLIKLLEEKIKNSEINEAISIIEELGASRSIESAPLLIKLLYETDNANLRNSIALALSDFGNADAVVHLINVIKDPKTKGQRGTLLFALESFECSPYTKLFIDLFQESGFETSRQAYILLENISEKLQDEEKDRFKKKIQLILTDLEEKTDLLIQLLESIEK